MGEKKMRFGECVTCNHSNIQHYVKGQGYVNCHVIGCTCRAYRVEKLG